MSARLRYAAVLRAPHVTRLLSTALIARAPVGVNGLAIVLFVRAESGLVAWPARSQVAYALGASARRPVRRRFVDRRGAPASSCRSPSSTASCSGCSSPLGIEGAADGLLLGAGFLTGSAIPPVGSVLRALWPSLMEDAPDLVTTAYALDSVIVELAFMVGPLLVGLCAAYASPQLALLAAIVLVVGGTAAFAATAPCAGTRRTSGTGNTTEGAWGRCAARACGRSSSRRCRSASAWAPRRSASPHSASRSATGRSRGP